MNVISQILNSLSAFRRLFVCYQVSRFLAGGPSHHSLGVVNSSVNLSSTFGPVMGFIRQLLLGLFFAIVVSQVSSQVCFGANKRGLSDPNDPPFFDDNNDGLPASPAVQAIIPTYKFYCDCVNITSWETYVQPGGGNFYRAGVYDITFQVWRPSPTVTSSNGYEGCYSLVGENVFTSFTFTEGGLVRLSLTPPSNSIITAQSGDVVGYYTNSRNGNNEGIQLERDRDYTVNIIWYNSPNLSPNNLVSVGPNGLLPSSTSAAPMLKVSTTTIRCSPSSSVINGAASSSIEEFQPILSTSSITSPVELSSVTSSISSTLDFLSIPAVTATSSSGSYSSISPSATATVYGPPTDQSDSLSLIAVKLVSSLTPTSATVGVPGASIEQSRLLLLVVPVVVAVGLFLIVLAIVLALVGFRKMRSSTKIRVESNPCYSWGTISMEPNEAYESVKEASKVDYLDSTLIVKANSAYGSHNFGNPDAEITPVCCIAYDSMENRNKGSHNNENLTSTNDEAEYSYITT